MSEKEIDSMSDAMLGTFVGNTEEKKPSEMTISERAMANYGKRHSRGGYFEDVELAGDVPAHRGQARSASLHTTSKANRHDPVHRSFATAPAKSQVAAPSALRQTARALTMDDVDALSMDKLLKRVKNALLDGFEEQGWILTGESEAFMFQKVMESSVAPSLRAVAIKMMSADIMRDPSKTKIAKR